MPDPFDSSSALDPDESRLRGALLAIAGGDLVAIVEESGRGVLVAAAERLGQRTGSRLRGRGISFETSDAVPHPGELRNLVQAASELVSLAEVGGPAVIAEAPDAEDLIGADQDLSWLSVAEVTRLSVRSRVARVAAATLPIAGCEFTGLGYRSHDGSEHLALIRGEIKGRRRVLLEFHGQCLAGQALGSISCTCGPRLEAALERLRQSTAGILIHVAQPLDAVPIGPCHRGDRARHHRNATIAGAIVRDLAPASVWLGEPDDSLATRLGGLVDGAGWDDDAPVAVASRASAA
jgi:hypothetical protein